MIASGSSTSLVPVSPHRVDAQQSSWVFYDDTRRGRGAEGEGEERVRRERGEAECERCGAIDSPSDCNVESRPD